MVFENLAVLKAHQGKSVGTSEWVTVTQEMINDFAKATLDFQWIHLDVERAKKESPYGGVIAHGFLSLSLLPKMIESLIEVENSEMTVNYGLNKVRFPHPVPAGSQIRTHCTLIEAIDFGDNGVKATWNGIVEIEGIEKPACVAQFIFLYFE